MSFLLSSMSQICWFFARTQLPQAVGAAYSLKMDKKDACVVTYMGDGGTSEVTSRIITFSLPSPNQEKWGLILIVLAAIHLRNASFYSSFRNAESNLVFYDPREISTQAWTSQQFWKPLLCLSAETMDGPSVPT